MCPTAPSWANKKGPSDELVPSTDPGERLLPGVFGRAAVVTLLACYARRMLSTEIISRPNLGFNSRWQANSLARTLGVLLMNTEEEW